MRPYFGPFLGVFLAFLGLLRAFFGPDNLGKTHLSPESAKKGGDQPFWTSPESIRGKYNEHFPYLLLLLELAGCDARQV